MGLMADAPRATRPGEFQRVQVRVPNTGRCGTRGCMESNGHGRFGRLCAEHAAELLPVRERWDAALKANGVRGQRSDARPAGEMRVPTCCNPDCLMPRQPSHAFCEDCEAAGFEQGGDD